MTVVGIGTDLVAISRLGRIVARHGERFAARILAPPEYQIWQDHAAPTAYLARRWAAKEAAAKALGTGIGASVGLQDLCVTNAAGGAPHLAVSGRAADTARLLGVAEWHISISDDGDFALAFVIAAGGDGPGRGA